MVNSNHRHMQRIAIFPEQASTAGCGLHLGLDQSVLGAVRAVTQADGIHARFLHILGDFQTLVDSQTAFKEITHIQTDRQGTAIGLHCLMLFHYSLLLLCNSNHFFTRSFAFSLIL